MVTPCTGTPACSAWTWGRRRGRCSGCRWAWQGGDEEMLWPCYCRPDRCSPADWPTAPASRSGWTSAASSTTPSHHQQLQLQLPQLQLQLLPPPQIPRQQPQRKWQLLQCRAMLMFTETRFHCRRSRRRLGWKYPSSVFWSLFTWQRCEKYVFLSPFLESVHILYNKTMNYEWQTSVKIQNIYSKWRLQYSGVCLHIVLPSWSDTGADLSCQQTAARSSSHLTTIIIHYTFPEIPPRHTYYFYL